MHCSSEGFFGRQIPIADLILPLHGIPVLLCLLLAAFLVAQLGAQSNQGLETQREGKESTENNGGRGYKSEHKRNNETLD